RHDDQLRQRLGAGAAARHPHARREGLAQDHAADGLHPYRRSRNLPGDGGPALRQGPVGRGEGRDRPAVRACRGGRGASRAGGAGDDRLDRADALRGQPPPMLQRLMPPATAQFPPRPFTRTSGFCAPVSAAEPSDLPPKSPLIMPRTPPVTGAAAGRAAAASATATAPAGCCVSRSASPAAVAGGGSVAPAAAGAAARAGVPVIRPDTVPT